MNNSKLLKEDAVDKAIEEGEIVDDQDEYKNDDEQ